MAKKRRGMIIKNTNTKAVDIEMATRVIRVGPGEEKSITADEVRDPALRENLQIRAISIVRPTTEEEDDVLRRELFGERQGSLPGGVPGSLPPGVPGGE